MTEGKFPFLGICWFCKQSIYGDTIMEDKDLQKPICLTCFGKKQGANKQIDEYLKSKGEKNYGKTN